MTTYLDCNATTPIEGKVLQIVRQFTEEEYGNAGSRTHEFGVRAKKAVQKARDQIAKVVACQRDEVIFTSGATESDNLAILGLRSHGEQTGKKHIITTAIEHKAVLEPLQFLEQNGFEISWIDPGKKGWVSPEKVSNCLRPDTLLVSIMHVNNETGAIQPIDEIVRLLDGNEVFFHTDAAQSFGKLIDELRNPRIDLISISGHKIFGPKGVGALISRRRRYRRLPLQPLMFGGGQEHGLRPGTLPVALIAGLGLAAELALKESKERRTKCLATRERALAAFENSDFAINGDPERIVPHVLNISLPGVSAEAAMVALKGLVAISNGSACTSHSYTPSHVLTAMDLSEEEVLSALRISWCHLTDEVHWDEVVAALKFLQ